MWHRVEWRASAREYELLENLREEMGIRHHSDVIRFALRFLARHRLPHLLLDRQAKPTKQGKGNN